LWGPFSVALIPVRISVLSPRYTSPKTMRGIVIESAREAEPRESDD
jgi:hypothetical protein